MTVETHIDRARTRVAAERTALERKANAFEAFIDRVSDLPATPTPSTTAGMTTTVGTSGRRESTDRRCQQVRTAFEETVRPHSTADVGSETLLETVRSEFSDSVAVALAPTTDPSFSPGLKQTLVSGATARRAEAVVTGEALEREAAQLDSADETAREVTGWIEHAEETPLSAVCFDSLRRRHESLTSHRERCRTLLRDRQSFLHDTTSRGTDVRVRHRSLVDYLYEDFPVDYPVLSTVIRLESTCRACQRAVRAHLVRRA
jgi:hypothetical protein